MRIGIITIFPDYLTPPSLSLVGKAIEVGIVGLAAHNLRWWIHDWHHTTDDTPYGGGAGMVMKPEPWDEAMDTMKHLNPAPITVAVPTPTGRALDQNLAHELSIRGRLVFVCGCYEGIDQRVLDHRTENYELTGVSFGDYVLNGGEVAVLTITEVMVRLTPGVIGNLDPLVKESHTPGHRLSGYPNYTKFPVWRGRQVSSVLLSGNHATIATWRRGQALERTRQRRPDLSQNGP